MVYLDIKQLNGSILRLDADVSDTIGSIKAKVHDAGLPPYDKQRFIYDGKELNNFKTLADYGILDNNDASTIHVIFKEEDIPIENFTVKINKPDGNILEIKYDYINNDDTIQLLKHKISVITRLHPKKYDLYIGDIKLETQKLLKSFITKSDTFDIKMY